MIALVAAVADNSIIGANNELPWHLPDDLRYFRQLTTGKTVVMGRTTFESIIAAIGKPLPKRKNIVLSRDNTFTFEGVEIMHDISELTTLADDVYIIGGAQIYAATIDIADTLYVTEVHARVDGDAKFPEINTAQWHEISRTPHTADEAHQYAFDFVIYKK